MMSFFKQTGAVLALLSIVGCAVTPTKFYDDPAATTDTGLCRVMQQTTAASFKQDVQAELNRRGISDGDCRNNIVGQNAAIAVIGVAATAVAIGVACSNRNCGSGWGGGNSSVDRDCLGGTGNGPLYVQGPVHVGSYDPYHLDADNDGIGCEVSDVKSGA